MSKKTQRQLKTKETDKKTIKSQVEDLYSIFSRQEEKLLEIQREQKFQETAINSIGSKVKEMSDKGKKQKEIGIAISEINLKIKKQDLHIQAVVNYFTDILEALHLKEKIPIFHQDYKARNVDNPPMRHSGSHEKTEGSDEIKTERPRRAKYQHPLYKLPPESHRRAYHV
jgi:hypothetical protein